MNKKLEKLKKYFAIFMFYAIMIKRCQGQKSRTAKPKEGA